MRLVCPCRCWPLWQRSRAACSSTCCVWGRFRESGLSRLDRRSGCVPQIRRQIVPNNSVNLPLLTTEHCYVMSPHIVQTFFSVVLYGTKSQTVNFFLGIREVRLDQGDVKPERCATLKPARHPGVENQASRARGLAWRNLLEMQMRPALMRTAPLHDSTCSSL